MGGLDQQAVLEMIPAGVVVVKSDGSANTFNQAFCDLMGRQREVMLHRGWLGPFEPESRTRLIEALAGAKDFTCTLQVRPESCAKIAGMRFEVRGQWSLTLRMHVCVVRQVARARPGKEADRFRLLANKIPALIAYFEINGRCCFANRQYARAYGLTEQSIVGMHYSRIIGEQAAEDIRLLLEEGAKNIRAVSYARQRLERDGSRRWIEVNALPQLGADGKPRGAFVVVTDISKHRLAPEQERARIARELHDGIAQCLVSLQFIVESAVTQVECGSREARFTLEAALASLGNVLREVRRIAHDLVPGAIDELGLATAMRRLIDEFRLRSNMRVEEFVDEMPSLPDAVSTAFFRVAQEALSNVERHACASNVVFGLRHGAHGLTLRIADDGCGLDKATTMAGCLGTPSLGMSSMRDRIESIGGRFTVESDKRGTSVTADLPPEALVTSIHDTECMRFVDHVA